MKLTVLQTNLKKAVSFTTKIVSTRTQLPILSNILLETKEGRLKITATNLETNIGFWIGATIEEEGSITIPARVFWEIINTFTCEKVELVLENMMLKIKYGRSQATLSGISATEFPPFAEIDEDKIQKTPRIVLEKSLPFVTVAASQDESKPLLTGIRIANKNNQTVFVATDGFRLALRKLEILKGFEEGVVMSAKAMLEMLHLVVEEKEEEVGVVFSADKNQIVFVLKNSQIATRLIEGEYPPYERIIPSAFTTKTIFQKEGLLQAVKLASKYARESSYIFKIKIANNTALVSANTPQVGENKTEVEVVQEGEGGEIAFNARFFLDMLNSFPEEEIVFEMNGPLAPGVFRPRKDQSFLHIIMPVMVQE